jgi:hypothetical protein
MATMSITSNEAPLNLHLRFWRCQPQTRNITNPRCGSNKQVNAEGRPRSGSTTRIPISSLSRLVCRVPIPTQGSSRSPFRQTNSRSMAAKPMLAPTKASKPLSYLRGRQRVAISVSGSRKPTIKSLEEERVSSCWDYVCRERGAQVSRLERHGDSDRARLECGRHQKGSER